MSNLIISKSNKKAIKYIKTAIYKKENNSINIFNNIDIFYYDNCREDLSTDTIREINKFLTEKSLLLKNKYAILSNFNSASIEAQNAFLKTLEENLNGIFLIADNTNRILSTVLSRVFIINLNSKTTFNTKIQSELHKIISQVSIGEIKDLTKNYSFEKLLNNLEYYLYKHKNNIETVKLEKSLKKLYEVKNRAQSVKLNSEIQLTNIIAHLMD